MKIVAVSACLIGKNTKYNGGNNLNNFVMEYLKDKKYVVVCPEFASGLPIPRQPSEQKNERVFSKDGNDVTEEFMKGSNVALNTILNNHCEEVILKANSPSCGYKKIYDGNFNGTLIDGNGTLVKLLIKENITIYTEKDIEELIKNGG